MPLRLNDIHLCETAIHKQFRSSDVAAVIVREKHHGLCDLLGRTDPAERHDASSVASRPAVIAMVPKAATKGRSGPASAWPSVSRACISRGIERSGQGNSASCPDDSDAECQGRIGHMVVDVKGKWLFVAGLRPASKDDVLSLTIKSFS
jgi:hypothetical protein